LIDLESARIPEIPESVKTITNESEIIITREIDIVENALSASRHNNRRYWRTDSFVYPGGG
jgi:hypothetical protein